ncbi:dipeptidase [Maricaulis salignorans]|uniref:dipeptidase n=1 Tax=Maricaulis salignorans TaxID=144026 RepID=UPI003A90854E
MTNILLHRRNFLMAGTAALAAPTFPVASRADAAQLDALMARARVINGNMLPAFESNPEDEAFGRQLRATGLTAVKYSLGGAGAGFDDAVDHIGWISNEIARHEAHYLPVLQVSDIARAKASGRIGIIYAFEDATMFDDDIERIPFFHALGVRAMQLSYNGTSPWASGVMVADETAGLSESGHRAVNTMNAVGVTIDTSHSNDRSTLDIIAESNRPVMLSHAGCKGVYNHPRNRSDAALRAIADQGGVVGLYELAYLTPGLEQQTLSDYLRHLLYALNLCGTEHVGIGSDALMLEFDTSPASMEGWNASIVQRRETGVAAPGEGPPPFVVGLNGPQRMRRIAEELLANGYSETVVEKVLGENFLRVFADTW